MDVVENRLSRQTDGVALLRLQYALVIAIKIAANPGAFAVFSWNRQVQFEPGGLAAVPPVVSTLVAGRAMNGWAIQRSLWLAATIANEGDASCQRIEREVSVPSRATLWTGSDQWSVFGLTPAAHISVST